MYVCVCMCLCACVCVRACACVRACVRACVCQCLCLSVCTVLAFFSVFFWYSFHSECPHTYPSLSQTPQVGRSRDTITVTRCPVQTPKRPSRRKKNWGQVAEGERRLMDPRGPRGAPGLEPALSRAVLKGSSSNGFGTSAGSCPISLRLDFGGLVT